MRARAPPLWPARARQRGVDKGGARTSHARRGGGGNDSSGRGRRRARRTGNLSPRLVSGAASPSRGRGVRARRRGDLAHPPPGARPAEPSAEPARAGALAAKHRPGPEEGGGGGAARSRGRPLPGSCRCLLSDGRPGAASLLPRAPRPSAGPRPPRRPPPRCWRIGIFALAVVRRASSLVAEKGQRAACGRVRGWLCHVLLGASPCPSQCFECAPWEPRNHLQNFLSALFWLN